MSSIAAQASSAFALVALLAACATRAPTTLTQDQVDRFLFQRRERLAAASADFHRRVQFPRVERHSDGTLILERGELLGWLDQEFIRLRVTYVNESASTFDRIRLHFAVVDSLGREHGREDVAFVMPGAYRFTPGNSYTDEVQVPTGGAHETPGFDVRVEMTTETW